MIRVETPAGAFLYSEVLDASPATLARWRRALEILEEMAATRGFERLAEGTEE
jgi:hypothetical protein